MNTANIELQGGERDEDGVFYCVRKVVVAKDRLNAFMRQNDRFRRLPVILTRDTHDAPTVIL
jgi:hypothetical protein